MIEFLTEVRKWVYRCFVSRNEDARPTQVIENSRIVGPVAGRDINIAAYHAGPIQVSEEDDEYRAAPTPAEMYEEIRKVSMYVMPSVANTFAGHKVRWSGTLNGIDQLGEDEIDVSLKVTGSYVCMKVKLSDYPTLKTVRGGEPVIVTGTIEHVQTNGLVHLKEVKLRFDAEDSADITKAAELTEEAATPKKRGGPKNYRSGI